jgi:hypothetical protein
LEPQKVIVDTPAQKQVIPSITDREILTNIIHSPSLRVLKARATKRSIVAELIRSADIINTCRSVVPFTSRVNCMGLIEEVMVRRAEFCFSLPMPHVVEHGNTSTREDDDHEERRNESDTDYEVLDRLVGLPREGDKIAFKVLNLNTSFEPVVSGYRVGLVQSFEVETNTIKLNLFQQLIEDILEVSWISMIDVRIFPRLNEKGKQVAPCPRCNRLFEKRTGLRMHSYSCKAK